jgi:hypothetical protein
VVITAGNQLDIAAVYCPFNSSKKRKFHRTETIELGDYDTDSPIGFDELSRSEVDGILSELKKLEGGVDALRDSILKYWKGRNVPAEVAEWKITNTSMPCYFVGR